MDLPQTQPVVVVTGASAGIGRAVVREFAKRKARIGLIARGLDGLEAAKREVEAAGGQALILSLDVADPNAVEEAAEKVEKEFGPIDFWINNAMASVLAPFKEMTLDEFRRVIEVTFLGYVYGTHAALKRMLSRDRGVILMVGSALAYRSIPLQSAYCASKHAILGFYESLRSELLHDKSNVQVKMVQLPGVNTPQFEWIRNKMPHTPQPVGTMFQPELAAEAIVWTAYHDRAEFQLGFPTVEAILGDKIAPRLLDRYLGRTVYKGHQTETPEDPARPDNLFTPVQGDHGARGPFSDRAKSTSAQFWMNQNRGLIFAGLTALAAGVTLAALSDRKGRR